MNSITQTLAACALFSPLSAADLAEVSARAHLYTRHYHRDEVVALEEDPCSALGIVAAGSIHIQRIFPSGKLITLETFGPGDSFGEALVFTNTGVYPATLVAKEDTSVLYIPRADIIQVCTQYAKFLDNFLRTLSERILLLNSKIKSLSLGSVRQKVAHFLLEEQRRQQSSLLTLTYSRHEMADSLGIPRPSLSRELIAMQAEGWITFDRRTITLLDADALERALY